MTDTNTSERSITRLEVITEQLVKDVHSVRNLIMSASAPADLRLSQHEKAVNTRLDAIEANQRSVLGLIEKLDDKLDARAKGLDDKLETKSKFPFAQVFSFITILMTLGGGIGGMILSNVKTDVGRVERDLAQVQSNIVPRIEHTGRWAQHDSDIAKVMSRIEQLEGRRR
ncbi:MAG: hypothetical protein EOO77_37225 [Oxalobacteraceae bacterium]|nr:MAG: hypothetical protein EOO77_37225 [Oxalobacteraceae bacterium]